MVFIKCLVYRTTQGCWVKANIRGPQPSSGNRHFDKQPKNSEVHTCFKATAWWLDRVVFKTIYFSFHSNSEHLLNTMWVKVWYTQFAKRQEVYDKLIVKVHLLNIIITYKCLETQGLNVWKRKIVCLVCRLAMHDFDLAVLPKRCLEVEVCLAYYWKM